MGGWVGLEIGLKGGDRDFRYDVAAFYYDYSDFQAQVENPSPPPFFIATNAGNAHAVGLELSLDGELADGLRAFFNYGYIGARFNALDDDGNPQQLAGNRFRLTPDHTAALGLDWRVDLGSGTFYLRPSATWRSKVFFEDANQPGIEQGAYALVNLNLGWRFDYQILTPGLRRFVRSARLPRQPRFSQHAPLIVDYDWTLTI